MSPARFPDGVEWRAAMELRSVAGRRLEGYAAVFGVEARIGAFFETIRPGAFSASLASGEDVLALVDHEPSRLLARSRSGTLRLAQDSRGLAFDISVPNSTLGADVLEMVSRGDVGGASFSFRTKEDHWPDAKHRELRAVDLLEVSIVSAFPAYSATTVSARSRLVAGEAARLRLRRLMAELI